MWEKFGDSDWNIPQARSTVAQLRHHAGDGREYDGIELFLALCEYIDLLHGQHGFDYFYTGAEQAGLAAAVQDVRGPRAEPDPPVTQRHRRGVQDPERVSDGPAGSSRRIRGGQRRCSQPNHLSRGRPGVHQLSPGPPGSGM